MVVGNVRVRNARVRNGVGGLVLVSSLVGALLVPIPAGAGDYKAQEPVVELLGFAERLLSDPALQERIDPEHREEVLANLKQDLADPETRAALEADLGEAARDPSVATMLSLATQVADGTVDKAELNAWLDSNPLPQDLLKEGTPPADIEKLLADVVDEARGADDGKDPKPANSEADNSDAAADTQSAPPEQPRSAESSSADESAPAAKNGTVLGSADEVAITNKPGGTLWPWKKGIPDNWVDRSKDPEYAPWPASNTTNVATTEAQWLEAEAAASLAGPAQSGQQSAKREGPFSEIGPKDNLKKRLDPCIPSVHSGTSYDALHIAAPTDIPADEAGARLITPKTGTVLSDRTGASYPSRKTYDGKAVTRINPVTHQEELLVQAHVQWQPGYNALHSRPDDVWNSDPAPQIWIRGLHQQNWQIFRAWPEDISSLTAPWRNVHEDTVKFFCYADDAGKKYDNRDPFNISLPWLGSPWDGLAYPEATGPSRGIAQAWIPMTSAIKPGFEVRVISRTFDYREPGADDPYDRLGRNDPDFAETAAQWLNWGADNATILIGAEPKRADSNLTGHTVFSETELFVDDGVIVDDNGLADDIETPLRGALASVGSSISSISGKNLGSLGLLGTSMKVLLAALWGYVNWVDVKTQPYVEMYIGKSPVHGPIQTNDERTLRIHANLGTYRMRATWGSLNILKNCTGWASMTAYANATAWLDNDLVALYPQVRLDDYSVNTSAVFSMPIGPAFGPGAWSYCTVMWQVMFMLLDSADSHSIFGFNLNNTVVTSVNNAVGPMLRDTVRLPAPSIPALGTASVSSLWNNTCDARNGQWFNSIAVTPNCQGGDVSLTDDGIEAGLYAFVNDSYPLGFQPRFPYVYRYDDQSVGAITRTHRDTSWTVRDFGLVVEDTMMNSILRALVEGSSSGVRNGILDLNPSGWANTVSLEVHPKVAPIIAPIAGQTVNEISLIIPDLEIGVIWDGGTATGRITYSTTLIARVGIVTDPAGKVSLSLSIDPPQLLLKDCPAADSGPTFAALTQLCNWVDLTNFDGVTTQPDITVQVGTETWTLDIPAAWNDLVSNLNTELSNQLSAPILTTAPDVGIGKITGLGFQRWGAHLSFYGDVVPK